jgi:predicted DNA-binding transcriptional regulator AlpA
MDQAYITIVRYRDLRNHGVPQSRPQISRMVREGLFPAPVELSSMAIGWRLSDIRDWLANRPVRKREYRPHSEATRAKMRAAWVRRRARRRGPEAALTGCTGD